MNLIGATSITIDVTLVASEWPSGASLSISKIALMDHTFWVWQEASGITATKISGADPPAPDGGGNIIWTPSMGDATWTISWTLASISKTNDVYGFYIAMAQPNVAKASAGFFYIDNIRVIHGAAETTTTVVIGNWEGASYDNWVPGWNGSPVLTPGSTSGVTLGSGSLCVQWTGAGWDWVLQWSAPAIPTLRPGTLFKFDLTAFGSDFTNWAKVADAIAINSDGVSGWKQYSTTTATNRNTGVSEGLDFGSWSGTVERTYSLDISDYDATGATWFQIIISMQVDAGDGKVYLDNARLTYPVISVPERLHTEGNKIKNSDGSVVVLRGVSLIDLGFLQGWQGGAINMVDRLTDENDANCGSPGWYTKIIRIPIAPTDSNTATWPYRFNPDDLTDPANETLYYLLRSVVDRCAEKGVYAVIDWHYVANTYDHVASTSAFWTYMAPRFKDDTHVIFELFNEPINNDGTDAENWASVKSDMETWIGIVRALAPDNLIFVGTPRWCQIIEPTVDNPVNDPNVVYVTHIYPYHWLNDPNQYYRQSITAAAAVHPVVLGEWGFTTTADSLLNGTISNYGQPLKTFVEGLNISSIAWVASHDWGPPMFDYDSGSGVWTLRCGEGEMGGFAKNWLYDQRTVESFSELAFNRCKVTAGKTQGLDAFEASGTFTVLPTNFEVNTMDVNIISLADGNSIYSEDCNLVWDLTNNRFIRSYKIPKGGAGKITLLMLDFRRKTVVIKASNINLTGLGCPLRLNITLGDFVFSGDINETVVNGRNPIPIRLMRTYKDTLAVSKASVSNSAKPLRDSFSAKGSITVQDINGPNVVDSALVITWADQNETSVQTFTIPAHSFRAAKKGHSYTCKNIRATEAGGGIVNANINLDKCTFTLSVKNTNLSVTSGDVELGLSFAAFDETADYSLPRRR